MSLDWTAFWATGLSWTYPSPGQNSRADPDIKALVNWYHGQGITAPYSYCGKSLGPRSWEQENWCYSSLVAALQRAGQVLLLGSVRIFSGSKGWAHPEDLKAGKLTLPLAGCSIGWSSWAVVESLPWCCGLVRGDRLTNSATAQA